MPLYKIASFEITDLPLIRKVAATGKPMIISTGMATVGEIYQAVRAARAAGNRYLVLLKCTSTYPATADDANIATIPHIAAGFDCHAGLSDHTMGIGVAVCIVGLTFTYFQDYSPGATIVVLAIALYAAVAVARPLFARRPWHDPHPEIDDDVELARERGEAAPEDQEARR